MADTSLNAFYYTLKTDAYDHIIWNNVTTVKAIRVVPDFLYKHPLFLSINDTMVEKSGSHFELCSKLYDHASYNGSNYFNCPESGDWQIGMMPVITNLWKEKCFLSAVGLV